MKPGKANQKPKEKERTFETQQQLNYMDHIKAKKKS